MRSPKNHRCGKHVVIANPASQIPVWIECPVHRGGASQVRARFADIVGLEFLGEEVLHLGWIVKYGMLD
jgi:hypothetical protein